MRFEYIKKKNLLTDSPKNIVLNIRNPHADVLLLPLRGNRPLDAAVPLVEEISHHPSGHIHWLSFGIFTFFLVNVIQDSFPAGAICDGLLPRNAALVLPV